jgi:hypothetical protein
VSATDKNAILAHAFRCDRACPTARSCAAIEMVVASTMSITSRGTGPPFTERVRMISKAWLRSGVSARIRRPDEQAG